MVRLVQTGFNDDEWVRISNWIAKREGMSFYTLLKQAALEYIDRYQGKDAVDVPAQIKVLIDDLKRFNRKMFDHASNVRWLKGRHGVTDSTANESLRIYETEVLTVL